MHEIMRGNKNVDIDIELETDVFTSDSAANLITSTIEYLLFQRHQIPFVFPTFKYMTSKWSIREDNTYETFHIEKQRRLALSTLNDVNTLCENIKQECKQNDIFAVRLLFGATPLTPKEVYVIKLPKVSRQHSTNNHSQAVDRISSKVIMSLLTCEKLYQSFSNNLGATNMYLDIETSNSTNRESDDFQVKDEIDFPSKCATVHINLVHKPSMTSGNNCCGDIVIFEGVNELSLHDNMEQEVDSKNLKESDCDVAWREAKIFIRGFKDIFVKGRSIWED